jgi:DNA-3-methyladenine glycosylase II
VITSKIEKEAVLHISKVDPIMGEIIKKAGPLSWVQDESYFFSLTSSIVGQQLSVKAARTIWQRFEALLEGGKVTPDNILALSDQSIRDVGVSWQKISYIKDLAQKTLESGILFEQFDIMTDEEIITELVKVKGIGRWTAEMFLMFRMQRPDVFSYSDLGLRRGLQKVYQLKVEPTEKQAESIVKKWSPYKTIGSQYLWKSLEL